MARVYEKDGESPRDVELLDWQLVRGVADLFESYGPVRFQAQDSRGSYVSSSVDEFRREVESQDESPERVQIEVATDVPEMRFAQAWWWARDRGARFRAASHDEAFVSHIATRVPELFDAAANRFDAKRRAEESVATHVDVATAAPTVELERTSWLRRFLYDPWTVRIGGGLAVAGVIALIVALR